MYDASPVRCTVAPRSGHAAEESPPPNDPTVIGVTEGVGEVARVGGGDGVKSGVKLKPEGGTPETVEERRPVVGCTVRDRGAVATVREVVMVTDAQVDSEMELHDDTKGGRVVEAKTDRVLIVAQRDVETETQVVGDHDVRADAVEGESVVVTQCEPEGEGE